MDTITRDRWWSLTWQERLAWESRLRRLWGFDTNDVREFTVEGSEILSVCVYGRDSNGKRFELEGGAASVAFHDPP